MNVLLFSMPDSFEHMPSLAIRMPNGALASLAGNVDAHHRVAAADLVLVQHQVRQTVERLVREWEPDVVGLSVMTFQRRTAHRLIRLVRALRPSVRIVVGVYYPSLATDEYEGADGFRSLWRPIFYRERANGTARLLVIGRDPAQTEAVTRRILSGQAAAACRASSRCWGSRRAT